MPEQEQPEPAPQGRVASAARELRWFAKFLAAINGEQAPRYVALVLTFALMVLTGYLLYEQRESAIRSEETKISELGMRLAHDTQEKERDRIHQKMLLDLLLRDTKDDRKSMTQISIALGILSKTVEARLAAVEEAVGKVLRYLKPNQTLFEFVPDLFWRVNVAPMPRAIAEPSCTGPRASTNGLQQPEVGHPPPCPDIGPR